ncbi:MAG: flagellar hook-length control protein FliK [Nitrosospira sp.]|nr:flagellar hook-length control protein FliK [Nitrosospira sp.]
MMPPLPMLHNSSSLAPKGPAAAIRAAENTQPVETASFGKMLDYEMSGKDGAKDNVKENANENVSKIASADTDTGSASLRENAAIVDGDTEVLEGLAIIRDMEMRLPENFRDRETSPAGMESLLRAGITQHMTKPPGSDPAAGPAATPFENRPKARAGTGTKSGIEAAADDPITRPTNTLSEAATDDPRTAAATLAYFRTTAQVEDDATAPPDAPGPTAFAAAIGQRAVNTVFSQPGKGNTAMASPMSTADLIAENSKVSGAPPPKATQATVIHAASIRDMASGPDVGTRRGTSPHLEHGFPVPGGTPISESLPKSLPEFSFISLNHMASRMESPLSAPVVEPVLALSGVDSPDVAAPRLEPRLGTADWDNALGQKVLWMVSQQQQIAQLSLNPPGLGPLQVALSIINDQANATFFSQHADVRQALEAALPRLREMMAESGISLGHVSVSSDSSGQKSGFEQQGGRSAHSGGGSQGMTAAGNIGTSSTANHLAKNRLVDIFA